MSFIGFSISPRSPLMTATMTRPANLFKSVTSSGSKKKGTDEKPVIHITDPALALAVENALHHAFEQKSHETLAKANREQVVAGVRPLFHELCRKRGESLSSITLDAGKVKATFVSTCMYTDIIATEVVQESLRATFGEAYDRYFIPVLKIEMKKESASDQAVLDALIAAVGEDFVMQHFTWANTLKVSPALHADLQMRDDVRERAKDLVHGGVITQYAPSLRLG